MKKTLYIYLIFVCSVVAQDKYAKEAGYNTAYYDSLIISNNNLHNFVANSTLDFNNGFDYQTFTIGRNDNNGPSLAWTHNGYQNNNYLYLGLFWIGYADNTIKFVPGKSSDFIVTQGNPLRISYAMVDSLDTNMKAICNVYSWDNKDFLIYEYTMINTGGKNLKDVYAGLYMDLDMSSAAGGSFWSDDQVGFYKGIRADSISEYISYMYDADNPDIPGDDTGGILTPLESAGYIGSRIVSSPPTKNNNTANVQYGHTIDYIPPDPFVGGFVWNRMISGQFSSRPFYPGDNRYLQSLGPWDIAAGDSIKIAFAIGAGLKLSGLRQTLSEAYELYWRSYYPQKIPQVDRIYPSGELVTAFIGDSLYFEVGASDENDNGFIYNWLVNGIFRPADNQKFVFYADSLSTGLNMVQVEVSNKILTTTEIWFIIVLEKSRFMMSQNYPNPFNNFTRIPLEVWQPGNIRIELIDITGKRMAVLIDEYFEKGKYIITWKGNSPGGYQLSSGVYFYKLISGDYREIKKLIIVK